QLRTGEGHRAKERAEGARVVLFDPERLSTVVTLGMGRNKGRHLLCYQMLLQRREETLRFGRREAQMLDLLVRLLHHRDFRHLLFTTILCTHDELHLDFHGGSSRPKSYQLRSAFYSGRMSPPQLFDGLACGSNSCCSRAIIILYCPTPAYAGPCRFPSLRTAG